MGGGNYYLITALPSLGELCSRPPMKPAAFLTHVREAGEARTLAETIFLSDDLLQRDALLADELAQAEPTVLSADQLSDKQPLPEYLSQPAGTTPPAVAGDTVWAAYFRHAAGLARRIGSRFLGDWVAYEVALRNALADARAKALDLDGQAYVVAPELGQTDLDLAGIVNEWSAAEDPLAGLRVIDSARWRWLVEHDSWFAFSDDELAAYAAKLMLLGRWHRLTEAARQAPVPAAAQTNEGTPP